MKKLIVTLALAIVMAMFATSAAAYTSTTGIPGISVGLNHYAAVDLQNALYTWGENSYGQLGTKDDKAQPNPFVIMRGAAFADCGDNFTLAVATDGTLYAFGLNDFGQLGDGGVQDSSAPVKIMDGVKQAAGGTAHTLILGTDGKLWACGDGQYGQLGLGKTTGAKKPQFVMNDVKLISAGGNCSFAVKSNGDLYAFGQNNYGQLGNGKTENALSPVKVLTNIVKVDAGGNHTIAKNTKGELLVWGSNEYGQLGLGLTGGTVKKPTPLGKYDEFSVGLNHSAFLEGDSIYVCGQDSNGQFIKWESDTANKPIRITWGVAAVVCGGDNTLLYTDRGSLTRAEPNATKLWKLANDVCADPTCVYNGDLRIANDKSGILLRFLGGNYPDWYGGLYLCVNNNVHVGITKGVEFDTSMITDQHVHTFPVTYSYQYLLDLQEKIAAAMPMYFDGKYGIQISGVGIHCAENYIEVSLVVLNSETVEAFKQYVSDSDAIRFTQLSYDAADVGHLEIIYNEADVEIVEDVLE